MDLKGRYKLLGTVVLLLVLLLIFRFLLLQKEVSPSYVVTPPKQNQTVLAMAEKLVKVKTNPSFDYQYSIMKQGVIQHIDRKYTYDVIPEKLLNGLLFQGIHKPPKGTTLEFDLFKPAMVYVFFHDRIDGGYTAIFNTLKGWQRSDEFPQYDIHNIYQIKDADHGKKMVMFQKKMQAGHYVIPPTTKDRGCFNLVFQPENFNE